MIETFTYRDVLPDELLRRYSFMETGSAAAIAKSVCSQEYLDIKQVLFDFTLTPQLLLTKGGSRGPIPRIIDGAFASKGWIEARVDLFKRAYRFPGHNMKPAIDDPLGEYANQHDISEVYQQGYSVDNVKGRVALDVEWNPKDGNLDRDFSAYRAWHEEGLIDLCILLTRIHEDTKELADFLWNDFIERNPQYKNEKQTVEYGTTTTANFEKARERVLRGDLGTCPILVIGIGKKAWNHSPWDGRTVKYDKDDKSLYLEHTFNKELPRVPYSSIL